MRGAGVRSLLVYCGDYRRAHSVEISADRWGDGVRLSDIEPLFTCQACGKKDADVRPDFDWDMGGPTRDAGGTNNAPGLTIPLWPTRHG
jgi:hypothetical protein